jgi:hypothetical protein
MARHLVLVDDLDQSQGAETISLILHVAKGTVQKYMKQAVSV